MKQILPLILTLSMSSALMAQTTTYRDNLGRKTGTSETNSRGVTTYRDNLGRKDGTAETKGNGTTYRDNVGRKQGSSTTRR